MDLNNYSIDELQKEIERRKTEENLRKVGLTLIQNDKWPYSPVGRWKVTTEGDVEGRTTRHLGTHEGHVADIAFQLGNSGGYSLQFEPAEELPTLDIPKQEHVNIRLGISSGTWDMANDEAAVAIGSWLETEPTKIVNLSGTDKCNYYAAVKLHRTSEVKG